MIFLVSFSYRGIQVLQNLNWISSRKSVHLHLPCGPTKLGQRRPHPLDTTAFTSPRKTSQDHPKPPLFGYCSCLRKWQTDAGSILESSNPRILVFSYPRTRHLASKCDALLSSHVRRSLSSAPLFLRGINLSFSISMYPSLFLQRAISPCWPK